MTAYKATHSEILMIIFAKSLIEIRGKGAPLTPRRPHIPKFEHAIDAYKATKPKHRRKTRHWLPMRPHTLKSEWSYRKPLLYIWVICFTFLLKNRSKKFKQLVIKGRREKGEKSWGRPVIDPRGPFVGGAHEARGAVGARRPCGRKHDAAAREKPSARGKAPHGIPNGRNWRRKGRGEFFVCNFPYSRHLAKLFLAHLTKTGNNKGYPQILVRDWLPLRPLTLKSSLYIEFERKSSKKIKTLAKNAFLKKCSSPFLS